MGAMSPMYVSPARFSSPSGTCCRPPVSAPMGTCRGTGTSFVPERVQHVGVHNAVAERPLEEPCLARRVLVHETVVQVQVGLAGHHLLAERPPDHGLGGALEVGLALAGH